VDANFTATRSISALSAVNDRQLLLDRPRVPRQCISQQAACQLMRIRSKLPFKVLPNFLKE
jgi:hypothetical protein